MIKYRGKTFLLWLLDAVAITIAFVVAITIRYSVIFEATRNNKIISLYSYFFIGALILYSMLFWFVWDFRFDRLSRKEILWLTCKQQSVFVVVYIVFFFLFHRMHLVSRVVIALVYSLGLILCYLERLCYWSLWKKVANAEKIGVPKYETSQDEQNITRHCYIIGAKSIGQYGGFETFVMNLLQEHQDNDKIVYHVACKENGLGAMDLEQLKDAVRINDKEFSYCNAYGYLIRVPEYLMSAQAIFYDLKALKWACEHIEKNHIDNPIVYILASRVGPFEKKYVERIHRVDGVVFQNPDGHESWRRKWSVPVRKYWKISEKYAVKYSDLIICDSKNIESYIKDEYAQYRPKTTYIAYGSYITPSHLDDDDAKYKKWLAEHNLQDKDFYISVGRFVPENNFDIMIREFMRSNTKRTYAIITTENDKYARELQQKLQYKNDKRIKFVGTVYDNELLSKIRENACGYLHGHEVGGTNPSLLEALGSTEVNLLLSVGFNKEVAEESAFYWSKEEGDLARIIDRVDALSEKDRKKLGELAKKRIEQAYSWKFISNRYAEELTRPVSELRFR